MKQNLKLSSTVVATVLSTLLLAAPAQAAPGPSQARSWASVSSWLLDWFESVARWVRPSALSPESGPTAVWEKAGPLSDPYGQPTSLATPAPPTTPDHSLWGKAGHLIDPYGQPTNLVDPGLPTTPDPSL